MSHLNIYFLLKRWKFKYKWKCLNTRQKKKVLGRTPTSSRKETTYILDPNFGLAVLKISQLPPTGGLSSLQTPLPHYCVALRAPCFVCLRTWHVCRLESGHYLWHYGSEWWKCHGGMVDIEFECKWGVLKINDNKKSTSPLLMGNKKIISRSLTWLTFRSKTVPISYPNP